MRDMDAEQGSLGSQGSVDLPVDSGQARLIELGEHLQLMCLSLSKVAICRSIANVQDSKASSSVCS